MCRKLAASERQPARIAHHLGQTADEIITNLDTWMRANHRKEAVVTKCLQAKAGFGPRISVRHLENAAGKRGLFIHFKSLGNRVRNHELPAYYALLSTQSSLSDSDAALAVKEYDRAKLIASSAIEPTLQSQPFENVVPSSESGEEELLARMRWIDDGGSERSEHVQDRPERED